MSHQKLFAFLSAFFFPFGISSEGFLCLRYSIVGSFLFISEPKASFAFADDFQRQF
jgi:hypothetical protein